MTTEAGTTSYGYDKLNRLDTVKDGTRLLADYDYDAVGNLIQTKLANGSVESRQYDTRLRLTQVTTKNVTLTTFSDFKYTLDANHESYTFTDYNLVYQIQALCGFISSNIEESYFSIISMINVGKINPSSDSTYIGGESTISFNQVENFIISLENLLSYQC